MLNRLLELLREGGTRRITDLANELDTTPELVEAMLEDLARMGYLKRVSGQCSEKCAACPLAGMCSAGGASCEAGSGQVWAFAEKRE